ncbi:MAG: hypothetical protein ABSD39_07320, partial [Terriglobales bacterium]
QALHLAKIDLALHTFLSKNVLSEPTPNTKSPLSLDRVSGLETFGCYASSANTAADALCAW